MPCIDKSEKNRKENTAAELSRGGDLGEVVA